MTTIHFADFYSLAHSSESRERFVKWGRSSCWLLGGGYILK